MKKSSMPGGASSGTGTPGYTVGASIIAFAIFFLIVLSSNVILGSIISLKTLGLTVTLSSLVFMLIIVFILFIL
jgi:hypothetical protein